MIFHADLHEMSNLFFLGKMRKICLSSAEFAQRVVKVKSLLNKLNIECKNVLSRPAVTNHVQRTHKPIPASHRPT